MKQTAVEWLIQELNQKIDFIPMDKWDMIRDTIEQAKEMEREQIIEAAERWKGTNFAEQYYNETYKRVEQ